jgi:hypothetical protein
MPRLGASRRSIREAGGLNVEEESDFNRSGAFAGASDFNRSGAAGGGAGGWNATGAGAGAG